MERFDRVTEICAEFDIEVVPGNVYPKVGQTRALATLDRIRLKYGEGHLRLVLSTLGETKGNEGLITGSSLWATSDLIRACSEWVENDLSGWLEAWDKIPLGFLMWNVQELSGVTHTRHALAGAMYTMLMCFSSGRKANRDVDYSFLNRIRRAEEVRAACAA